MQGFERLVSDSLGRAELTLIVARRPCLLAAKKFKSYGTDDGLCEADG